MARERVFIVGGGIVGLSCALNAQARGYEVVVADPRGFGQGASFGNAGVIANSDCVPVATPGILRKVPAMLLAPDSPLTIRWQYAHRIAPWLIRFVLASTSARVQAAAEALAPFLASSKPAHHKLASDAGIGHLIREVGWLKVYETDAAYRAAAPGYALMRSLGVDCEYLSQDALTQGEPSLASIFRHGILHNDCAQVDDPGAYVRSLGELFLERGGRIVLAEVRSLERTDGRISRAQTGTDAFEADHFVVAAGAWSRKLAADAGSTVPLDTERGYHVVLDAQSQRPLTRPVYWAEKAVVMAPSDGKLRVTSSVEFAGLEAKADYAKLRALIPTLRAGVRSVQCGQVTAEWLGFRPSMPDSLPVISRAKKAANCFLAFGHGHIGFTAGPITGEVIGALIDGEKPAVDVSAFSAARFD